MDIKPACKKLREEIRKLNNKEIYEDERIEEVVNKTKRELYNIEQSVPHYTEIRNLAKEVRNNELQRRQRNMTILIIFLTAISVGIGFILLYTSLTSFKP